MINAFLWTNRKGKCWLCGALALEFLAMAFLLLMGKDYFLVYEHLFILNRLISRVMLLVFIIVASNPSPPLTKDLEFGSYTARFPPGEG